MHTAPAPKKCSQFYAKVKNEIKIFANVPCILDKVEQDGHLMLISNTFQQIFNREFVYAVFGRLKRTQEAEGQDAIPEPALAAADKHVHFQGEPEDDHQHADRHDVEGEDARG